MCYPAADKMPIQIIALTKVASDFSIAIPCITRLVYSGVNISTEHTHRQCIISTHFTQHQSEVIQIYSINNTTGLHLALWHSLCNSGSIWPMKNPTSSSKSLFELDEISGCRLGMGHTPSLLKSTHLGWPNALPLTTLFVYIKRISIYQ